MKAKRGTDSESIRVKRTENFTYNVRRGQIPDMDFETYQRLLADEIVGVSEITGKWLLERNYITQE